MSTVIVHRRGFDRLLRESDAVVVASVDAVLSDPPPRLLLFLCDHPDAFAAELLAAADRWPLTETFAVDSDWGLSAARTRKDVPPGWRVDEATAIRLLRDVATGVREPCPRPRTYSRQERVVTEPFAASRWPYVEGCESVGQGDRR